MEFQKDLERIKRLYYSKHSIYSRKPSSPKKLKVLVEDKNQTQYEYFYFFRKEFDKMLEAEYKRNGN